VTAADTRFLRTCHRQPADTTPIWFMRQAGRALPEYRALKERYSLLEITRQPELCAEVTLQPVRRLGVDAAILYADIMSPLVAIGIDVEIVEGIGPVIASPIRTEAGLLALRPVDVGADMPYVRETIGMVRHQLDPLGVPLIGFAGAPFTLASYLVEGRPSKTFAATQALMHTQTALWHTLMEKLATIVIGYARLQLQAGIQAFQLFDSWIGNIGEADYHAYIQPHVARIFRELTAADVPRVPLIHFGTGTKHLLELMAEAGGDIIGLDWRVPLDEGWRRVGGPEHIGVQGNLDPATLLEPWETVRAQAADVLRRAGGRPGHIFNLGHGILPSTPVDTLERLVAFVHERARAQAEG
jgi:uroporphyrinogen decarboxylase